MVSEICSILNTDLLQVKSVVNSLKCSSPRESREPEEKETEERKGKRKVNDICNSLTRIHLQSEPRVFSTSTGTPYEHDSRLNSANSQETAMPLGERGTNFFQLP